MYLIERFQRSKRPLINKNKSYIIYKIKFKIALHYSALLCLRPYVLIPNFMGHLNPMIGFGQMLVPEFHVVFAVNQKSKGTLTKYGFIEEIYEFDDSSNKDIKNFLMEKSS